ncbi:MAG: cob(I)yrinic acid a,c-diamide adenosyltransferase [Calditrichia bacterium]|nr:cob(I)yrinic acid a,c-diamide adenosyltransferase [Calditrichia bacterium]
MNINKVYTKKGDAGNTCLAGGQRVSKADKRIKAYGNVDELNAVLGIIVESINNKGDELAWIEKKFLRIQNELFNLGAQLSVLTENRRENTPVITEKEIAVLEEEIDDFNSELPPLKSFILPGGGEVSAHIHFARTVCRRAERGIVELGENEKLDGTEISYINRLSDWLFVISRFISKKLNIKENYWQNNV